jgi:mannonate dehydratase
MFIQDQLTADHVDEDTLNFYKAIGVDYLTIYPPPRFETSQEYVSYFAKMSHLAEGHGLKLQNIAIKGPDEITLGRPNKDHEIERLKQMIGAMGKVGIPTLGYNFKPIGNFRTDNTYGRGGAAYSTFNYDQLMQTPPQVPDKSIDERTLWTNMDYFLKEIIPVAEENNVRMALHPDDPPIPEPIGGAARIVSTLDQYKRIFDIVDSPSNAMLFCQGCVTEMGVDVYEAIREIGKMEKIVYVHFRNVKGSPRNFQEVFLDEGDVDMVKAMKVYKEVGFNGPFMMDHTPGIPGDVKGREGHAFATGYIRALIQTVYG